MIVHAQQLNNAVAALRPATGYDFLIHEPAEAYHARTGEYLSSHLLADFRRCPQLYTRHRQKQASQERQPALVMGQAAHALILEGRAAFDALFAVGGPINPRTQKPFDSQSQAYRDWEEAQGKIGLSATDFAKLESMTASVRAHEAARSLLARGVAEGVVRTRYAGVPCQIRMDWFDLTVGIVDLKTCDDLTWFAADAKRYGYLYQLAFYRAVLAAVIGVYVPVHLLAVEKKEPYRTGVWKLDPDALQVAQRENEAAIAWLQVCQTRDVWPTGYEDVRIFDAF